MKMILAVLVLGLAACGGTEKTAAPLDGQWTIQFPAASGVVTINGTGGSWDLGELGTGTLIAHPVFDSTELVFVVDATHEIVADANVNVSGDALAGTGATRVGAFELGNPGHVSGERFR